MKNNNFTRVFLTLTIAALFAIGSACSNYGTRLEFNGGELYYTQNVTEPEAKKLGDYLVKEGMFNGTPKTIQLDKSGSTYQVRMVIQAGKENDKEILDGMKIYATDISKDVFANAATEMHLCDDSLKTLKVVKP